MENKRTWLCVVFYLLWLSLLVTRVYYYLWTIKIFERYKNKCFFKCFKIYYCKNIGESHFESWSNILFPSTDGNVLSGEKLKITRLISKCNRIIANTNFDSKPTRWVMDDAKLNATYEMPERKDKTDVFNLQMSYIYGPAVYIRHTQ